MKWLKAVFGLAQANLGSAAAACLYMTLAPTSVYGNSLSRSLEVNLAEREGLVEGETTLVWNQALGLLHPPLEVIEVQKEAEDPLDPPASVETRVFSVGDGRHGAFVLERYQEFSEGGDLSGNIIRLNTNDFPELLVTEFHLEQGWTLEPVGNQPLIIRSLSLVQIEGTIHCAGEPGQDQNSGSPQEAALGGQGRCGGGRGGNGGTVDLVNVQVIAAEDGEPGGLNVTGGGGAPAAGGGSGGGGGGGGGAYSQSLANADDGVHPDLSAAGAKGENFRDDAFEELGAGSGGGGGSGFDGSSGAGGGGGGGLVKILAAGDIQISPTGVILAQGGDGGGQATDSGGGGGGGGGGSVLLFAGGRVWLDGPRDPTEPFAVLADRGLAGASDDGLGGQGAVGRTWLTDSAGVPAGTGPEEPASVLFAAGRVVFATGTFSARLSGLDLNTSFPENIHLRIYDNQSPPALLSTPVVNATWESVGGELDLAIELLNEDALVPIQISQIHVDYSLFRLEEAQFISSCGHLNWGSSRPRSGQGFFWDGQVLHAQQVLLLLLLLAPLLVSLALRLYYSGNYKMLPANLGNEEMIPFCSPQPTKNKHSFELVSLTLGIAPKQGVDLDPR